MPDFDPKSIPILDDIIDEDKADTAKNKREIDKNLAEEIKTDGHLDIFDAEASVTETATETIESALIDYQANEQAVSTERQADTKKQTETKLTDILEAIDADQPIEIIVNDVVKKMMPDIEQQLRYLLQQALEENSGKPKS